MRTKFGACCLASLVALAPVGALARNPTPPAPTAASQSAGQDAGQGAANPTPKRGVRGRLAEADADYDHKDYAAAAVLYRQLADEAGERLSQTRLGVMAQYGQGTPIDLPAALAWYRKAADQGQGEALIRLGHMYFEGQAAPRDLVTAHKLISLGIARVSPQAEDFRRWSNRLLDAVVARMTLGEINQALTLAKQTQLPVETPPDWIRKPSSADISSYYPADAMVETGEKEGVIFKRPKRTYVPGKVILGCDIVYRGRSVLGDGVNLIGEIENCEVLSEDPKGLGFGPAAIRVIVERAIFSPRLMDGKPVIGQVRIPVSFLVPQSPEPAK